MHVGEAEIATGVAIRQTRVVKAELMQNSRVQVVYVDLVLDCLIPELVRDAVRRTTSHAASGKEDGRYSSESSAPVSREPTVSKKDVIRWTNEGVKDEIIIDRIERSGTRFEIRASDENELRDAGVSEEVVRAMKATRVARY